MRFFRRKPAGPLETGKLLCAYCVCDYLEWERDPSAGSSPPTVNVALAILPATVEGQAGGAAVCAFHLRPLLRTRRLLAERPREYLAHVPAGKDARTGKAAMPRSTPEAASA